jgi:hypothetical protein
MGHKFKQVFQKGSTLPRKNCFLTVMFTLTDSLSHVASAAFTQARLRLGSGLLTLITLRDAE